MWSQTLGPHCTYQIKTEELKRPPFIHRAALHLKLIAQTHLLVPCAWVTGWLNVVNFLHVQRATLLFLCVELLGRLKSGFLQRSRNTQTHPKPTLLFQAVVVCIFNCTLWFLPPGLAIMDAILQNKADWAKLFDSPNFFQKYKYVFSCLSCCIYVMRLNKDLFFKIAHTPPPLHSFIILTCILCCVVIQLEYILNKRVIYTNTLQQYTSTVLAFF